jgi:hypothetical protein
MYAFFTYTGAIVSLLVTGYALGEVGLLVVLTALTLLSWRYDPLAANAHYRRATGPLLETVRPYETRITIISAIWG